MNLVTLRNVGVAIRRLRSPAARRSGDCGQRLSGCHRPERRRQDDPCEGDSGHGAPYRRGAARTRTVPGQGAADRLHAPAIGFRPHVPHLGARSGIVGFAGAQGNFQPLYESRPREGARSAGNGGRGRIRPATLSAKFRAVRCSGRCCAGPSFPIPSC